ncbi:histone H3.v1-like [Panicum miliaceum]|uniref:Histone H3.v1-like n=1 Tax=Panicum miliaceum TaxID=4540 RepID=A0A3L6TN44_PANMI|nr:histone H3.v1-like [Panicum miliaceum]
MGCFLGCFGGAKERRRRRKRSPAQSPNGRARAAPRVTPKKVDLDGEVVSAAAPLLATLLELREKDWMLTPECAKSEAFPLNHRYSNCADSDNDSEYEDAEEEEYDEFEDDEEDEEEEDGLDECAMDDEEEHGLLSIGRSEEEACESLFLLPISKTPKDSGGQVAATGVAASEAPAVLNSVENLTQWKEAKPRAAAAPKSSDKENVTLGQENRMNLLAEPAMAAKKKDERPAISDYSYTPSTPSKQEASVDASLSTWLGSSGTPESNSVRSYSPISREDRPILGALTVEDIKISSANSSPRRSRSPSPSPDDMPILGTVGAYWNCSAKGADPVSRGGLMRTRTRFG